MKSLKGYFKNGTPDEPPKPIAEPTPTPSVRKAQLLTPEVIKQRRMTARSHSSYAAGSFRNEEEITNMKTQVMAEWLYKQQRLKLWASSGLEEGVILKRSRGEYTCCPEDLRFAKGGLFEQIMEMNVRSAMTIKTNVIAIFVASQQGDTASLQGGLSVQIIPNISYLSSCLKHQFAAFVRDRQMLVVWDDDADKIIEHATKLESLLMVTIWNNGANYADEEKDLTVEYMDEMSGMEKLEDGYGPEPPRKTMLLSPAMVGCTLLVILGSLGLGWRKLAVEASMEGSYIRFAFMGVAPVVFFVGLFTMQSLVNSAFQIFGPVNQVMQNSKAYSGKPPRRIISGPFPHVTIQMPVYREGLNAVIKPTVMSLKAAISTYELQGGTANIFVNDDGMQTLSEEEAAKRQDFYDEHDIGWVSRPPQVLRPKNPPADFDESTVFVRKGKFKKASNMNYALNVSNRVEGKLINVSRHPAWNKDMENEAYRQCLDEVVEEMQGKAWAGGNIRIGDYILLVDSDTRVPEDCLLDAASEMEQSPEIAIMQFTSGVMQVTTSFFESGISFFTRLIYTAISFSVASGDVCPFVGHNAILRWSAVQQVTFEDEDGYEKFWSESHVSEDFDMALRLQCDGYKIRLAAYQGDGFKEGVSLTVYDELARWQKYAYGCNELLFHPLRFWVVRGPFTPLFRKFIGSSIPIGAKLTILAYVGTYYAIGAGWILTVANFFLMGWFVGYLDQFYLDSFAIYFGAVCIFSGIANVALAVFRYRTNSKGLFASLWENFKWVPLLSIFLGGVSIHISQALLAHMFEIDMSWAATAKELEETSFFDEMPKLARKFWFTFIVCFLLIGLMISAYFFFPVFWQIRLFVAIYPLSATVAGHLLLPIALNPALMMFTF